MSDEMNTKMEMCVGEILDLAAWVEKLGLKRTHRVTIEQSSGGGIGVATQAMVKTSESEGVFIDITDYDMW
jgi:hypothetical protein